VVSDGDRIYFIAKRDGFHCVWVQALDRVTKRPRGPRRRVPRAPQPWVMWSPPWAFSLSVGRRQLVFNAAEITGNVLMGKLPSE